MRIGCLFQQFLEAGATGSSGTSVVQRVDSEDKRSAEESATTRLLCLMENNAKETRSTQSAVSLSTAVRIITVLSNLKEQIFVAAFVLTLNNFIY